MSPENLTPGREKGRQAWRNILLAEGAKISDVADRLGFSSPFHFSRAFRARYDQPPSALR